jgi:putative oxidoreductase
MEFFSSIHQAGDFGLLLLRISLGVIFWEHGMMKKGMWKMQPSEKLPAKMLSIIRTLSIAEPLGAAAIILGLFSQITAACFCIVMLFAIPARKSQGATFISKNTAGWELDFLILISSLLIVFMGAGQYALDHLFFGI